MKLIKCLNNSLSCFVEIVCKHSFSNHVQQMCVKLELIFVFTYQLESYCTSQVKDRLLHGRLERFGRPQLTQPQQRPVKWRGIIIWKKKRLKWKS